ncbi:MAG: SDR family oxidoreductase [Candidatus Eremiobacteraeota bacterium]|nr:SDR family oxidoreductase [Candidatus Eremiobacteraeota bacterium]
MSRLENKVAVITGGSSGIGFAAAKLFLKEGARVAITGRRQEVLEQAAAELGNNVLTIQGDISDPKHLADLFTRVEKKWGKVDVLFLNAGVAAFAPIDQVDEAHFDHLLQVNFKGPYFAIQRALPHLAEGASIVLNTSVANQSGMPNTSVYSASKAALRSLARTLSAELIGRGIRVNAISPGPVATPIFETIGLSEQEQEAWQQRVVQEIPLKRFGRPEELASAALFLASSDSSFVVGAELVADGGLTQV